MLVTFLLFLAFAQINILLIHIWLLFNIFLKVIEVTAEDADKEASLITYKIASGLEDFR